MTKVFLAGATGAIGKRLVPQLLDASCEVFGTTRSERKVAELKTAGVTPIVVDVFDAAGVVPSNDCGLPGNRHKSTHGSSR